MRTSSFLLLSVLGLLSLAHTGCSPSDKKADHLAKAEKQFAAGKYDEAEIEYKNVLQIEPQNPAALGGLGTIYAEQARTITAFPFLKKASELQPENYKIRLKLGFVELAFQDFKSARATALFVLQHAPQLEEAPLLLTQVSTNLKEVTEARDLLKKLPAAIQESAPVLLSLGILDLRENKPAEAEAAFKRALALNPKSSEGHAGLAAIYLFQKNLPLAEQELKQAAEFSPARSPHRIRYAQFKIQNGDTPFGRRLLTEMSVATPDFLPAWMLLAQIESVDRKYDESLAFVKRVLARDAIYPEALLLSARLRMAKGEFAVAVAELEKALTVFPTSPQLLYQLGLAQVSIGDTRKAIDTLTKALSIAPDYLDASLLQAGLNMRLGNQSAAIATLKVVVQKNPEQIRPWLLLADAYRSQNNLDDALGVYGQIEKLFPGNDRTPLLRGLVLLQQNKQPEARAAFMLALERAPDSQPVIEQLVNLDLREKLFPAAQQRVAALIAKQPKSAEAFILQAKVYGAQQDFKQAEVALQKSIEIQPDAPNAYFMLSQLHLMNKNQDKALENLQQIVTNNPKDTRALMMIALLNEQLKKHDVALATYEKILALDPKSGIALNNIANLYAEHFNQLEKGFEFAKKARELFPHEPNLADTLGWILVKKREYPWALTMLQESVEKLPASPEVQYHLGTVHYLLGEEAPARLALKQALQLNQSFLGSDDAKQRLAVLDLDVSKISPADRKMLETAAAAGDDPIALIRLATLNERNNEPKKAIELYTTALKASPANVPVMMNLIRLYNAQKDSAKAVEMAKTARKVAPDNGEIASILGRLAFDSRDYSWAYSLLQEAARKQANDAAGQRVMGQAAYNLGLVREAKDALNESLKSDALSAGANEARTMLEWIALTEQSAPLASSSDRIAQALKKSPDNVPVLLASAILSEQKPDARAAMATYEKLLEIAPDFTPAKKNLAILYADNNGDNKKALDLAMKARTAFPGDLPLAKAFGIILYRQGDFQRASGAFKECIAKLKNDAVLTYYYGMTQYQLKDTAAAKTTLLHALELNLTGDLAAEAKKTLATIK